MSAVAAPERSEWAYGSGRSWPTLNDEQRRRVEENVGLVGFALRKKHVPAEWHDDAFQDGVLGLMRAAQMFEPARGYAFSTYAMHWIKVQIDKGRNDFHGINARRAYAAGEEYVAPLSLDMPATHDGEGGGTLGILVLISVAPGPAREILAAQLVAEAKALVAGWEIDRIDRAIVDDLFVPTMDTWRSRDTRIGKRFGISHQAITKRRKNLHARLRRWAGEAAYDGEADVA